MRERQGRNQTKRNEARVRASERGRRRENRVEREISASPFSTLSLARNKSSEASDREVSGWKRLMAPVYARACARASARPLDSHTRARRWRRRHSGGGGGGGGGGGVALYIPTRILVKAYIALLKQYC